MKDMEKKNLKVAELQEKDLEKVAGGGWGYHDYHNKDEYISAGIECDWTLNPFIKDKFKYAGREISSETASALVFYGHAKGLTGNVSDIAAALEFKSSHGSEYDADRKNSNR